jgi:hypothetical protein
MTLLRSDTPVSAVLKAAGYHDKSVLIDASKSGTVMFTLEPNKAASAARPRERTTPPGRPRERKIHPADDDSDTKFKAVGD